MGLLRKCIDAWHRFWAGDGLTGSNCRKQAIAPLDWLLAAWRFFVNNLTTSELPTSPSNRSDGKNQPVDGSNLAAPGRSLRKARRDDCGKGLCRLVTDTWIRYCGGVQ